MIEETINNTNSTDNQATTSQQPQTETKFCQHCGGKIPIKAVVCTLCGCQVENIASNQNRTQPNIITNTNTNSNVNNNNGGRNAKNKWVSVLLCLFLGQFGAHKFYQDKVGMGVLYLFTWGLLGFGVIIDFFVLLSKLNPYYV